MILGIYQKRVSDKHCGRCHYERVRLENVYYESEIPVCTNLPCYGKIVRKFYREKVKIFQSVMIRSFYRLK